MTDRNTLIAKAAMLGLLAFIVLMLGLWIFNMPVFASTYSDSTTKDMLQTALDGGSDFVLSADALNLTVSGEDTGYAESSIFEGMAEDEEDETDNTIGLEGVLRIPSIDLEMPLLAGATTRNLRYSVCYDTNSSPPGWRGNFVVFGHRMKKYGRHFNRLDEVQIADRVSVLIGEMEYVYEVDDIRAGLLPAEMKALMSINNHGRRISLITCTPLGKGTHRLVVMGELVDTLPLDSPVGAPGELVDEGDDASGSFEELE